jgi:hypothetical protein
MVKKMSVTATQMLRLFALVTLFSLISQCMAAADLSQRTLDSEPLVIRKRETYAGFNFNSLPQNIAYFLSNILVIPSSNSVISNSSTLVLTQAFWSGLFNILQYFTFFAWFALLMTSYVGGVAILFLFQYVSSPYSAAYGGSPYGYNSQQGGGSLFRSFEDENLPLFDKVTSVGYGLLDRSGELYNLIQTPECMRYAMCHLSSTLGDQEANGYVFKDLLRSISASLDNKGGSEGMTRSVNVGLLTGECEEPIMSCPELSPYFKKVSDSWSNYL